MNDWYNFRKVVALVVNKMKKRRLRRGKKRKGENKKKWRREKNLNLLKLW
jgi:hypothetical protein